MCKSTRISGLKNFETKWYDYVPWYQMKRSAGVFDDQIKGEKENEVRECLMIRLRERYN